jgi:hypothetical protein
LKVGCLRPIFPLICLSLKIINPEKINNPIIAKKDCPFETASFL